MISALAARKWLVIGVVIIMVLGGLGYGYRSTKTQTTQTAFVTEEVKKGDLRVTVSATGAITGEAQVEARPEVAGTVSKVLVTLGVQVKAGDPMVHLTNDSLMDQTAQARIDLDMARVKLQEMKSPGSRATKAQIEIARDRVTQAELNLERKVQDEAALEVKAPISGDVDSLAAREGQNFSSNAVMAKIVDTSSMYLVFSVADFVLPSLKEGQRGEVIVGPNSATRSGEVSEIARIPRSNGTGLVYDIKFRIDPGPGDVRPGYSGLTNINTIGQGGELTIQSKGTVEAGAVIDVRLKTGGDLKQLLVVNGSRVSAGDVIARLENRDLGVSRRQAEVDLKAAQDNLHSLINPPVTATEADIRSQELRVQQLELILATKQRETEKLIIRSPIDGAVIAKAVNVGDRVGSGGSALITVANYSNLYLSISVDELDVGKLKAGQRARVTVDALGGKPFTAEVAQIAPAGTVSQGVANFSVLLGLKETGGLISGMTGNAVIFTAEKRGVLMVPLEAVTGTGERAMVRVVKGGKPESVQIKIGMSNDTHAEVVEGLAQGDIVVAGTISASGPSFRGFGGFGGGAGGRPPGGGAQGGGGNRGGR